MGKELLIVIPAYQEEQNIGKLLQSMRERGIMGFADVVVIDDASEDGTKQEAKAHGVQVVSFLFHMGYGSALQAGYRYALCHGYRYLIQMDADGQHDPCNIRPVYESLKQTDAAGRCPDVVLASRFMEGSGAYAVSPMRKIAFSFYRWLIRLFCGKIIHDPTSGMQGLGRRAFGYFAGYRHFDDKYPDANIILEMLLLGFSLKEVPAVMHKRTQGRGLHDGIEPVYYMFRMTFSVLLAMLRGKQRCVSKRLL